MWSMVKENCWEGCVHSEDCWEGNRDCESIECWREFGDSLNSEAGWEGCVEWPEDCEHCSRYITSEDSVDCWEDWVEVFDNWEGCCTGVSEVSDRKREEGRFHEKEKSAAMRPATWQMQQWTSSGQESVISPSSSQLTQNILGYILAWWSGLLHLRRVCCVIVGFLWKHAP